MMCPYCWVPISESDFSHRESDYENVGKLVCPLCQHDLPRNCLSASQHIISIVGSPASGKSYFLPIHLKELRHNLAEKYGCDLQRANENAQQIEDMMECVYETKQPLPMTTYDSTYHSVGGERHPKPYIYTLQAPWLRQVQHNLVYYDHTGCAFAPRRDTERKEIDYYHASGLVFMFDPFSSYEFRQCMANHSDTNDPQHDRPIIDDHNTMLSEISYRLSKYPDRYCENLPIAFIVGKYDAWRGLTRTLKFYDPTGGHSLDDAIIRENSKKLRELLLEICPAVVANVERLPGNVRYFPISNFGKPPTKNSDGYLQHPAQVEPFLVDVPMLWLIHQFAPEFVPGN